tara:strand:+ start:15788 stop:16183 length:396 start_codon:yes stop_codon:yes gene_type:complete
MVFNIRSYVKPGGKATGSMKDYKIGSQSRMDEYTARGWAQDDTTKAVEKPRAKVRAVDTIKTAEVKAVSNVEKKSVTLQTKLQPKNEVDQTRSQKIRAKGEAALASGNKRKAHRLRERYDRVAAREAKREQ